MNEPLKTPIDSETISRSDLRQLSGILQSLEAQIRIQNSYKYALLRGAVYGLGTVIGATLLIALFGTIITMFMTQLSQVPLVGDIIDQRAMETYTK